MGLFVFPLFAQNTFQHFGPKIDHFLEPVKKSDFSTKILGFWSNPQKIHFLTFFRDFFLRPKKWPLFFTFPSFSSCRKVLKSAKKPDFLSIFGTFFRFWKNRKFLKKRGAAPQSWPDFGPKSGSRPPKNSDFSCFWPLFGRFLVRNHGIICTSIPKFFQFFSELKRFWFWGSKNDPFWPLFDPFLTPFWPLFDHFLDHPWIVPLIFWDRYMLVDRHYFTFIRIFWFFTEFFRDFTAKSWFFPLFQRFSLFSGTEIYCKYFNLHEYLTYYWCLITDPFLDHFLVPFLDQFWPFWSNLTPFWPFFDHFWPISGQFLDSPLTVINDISIILPRFYPKNNGFFVNFMVFYRFLTGFWQTRPKPIQFLIGFLSFFR